MSGNLLVARLGLVDYQEAWELQKELAEARRHEAVPDVLLLMEHPPTFTLGRAGHPDNVLLSAAELKERGVALYEVDRGGDVTYHGPEQIVGYPILKRPGRRFDYIRYIRDLEAAVLAAVADLGVTAELKKGFSGVWIGDEKVCAIGVKIDAYGVTSHGFALNVNTDLAFFDYIIPCGLKDMGVTSLQRVLGRRISMDWVVDVLVSRIADRFDLNPTLRSVAQPCLGAIAAI